MCPAPESTAILKKGHTLSRAWHFRKCFWCMLCALCCCILAAPSHWSVLCRAPPCLWWWSFWTFNHLCVDLCFEVTLGKKKEKRGEPWSHKKRKMKMEKRRLNRESKNYEAGMPRCLSQWSIWLRVRSWSNGSWVQASHWALCWWLGAWSLLGILCLPLCPFPAHALLSLSLSLKNK